MIPPEVARVHALSNIDPVHRRADCAICGSVRLYVVRDRAQERFRCSVGVRQKVTKRKRGLGSIPMADLQSRQHVLSEIDGMRRTAICRQCGPTKVRPSYGDRGVGYRCQRADRSVRVGKSAKYWRRFRYGLSDAEFTALLASQDYRCAICKTPIAEGNGHNGLHVDHCHKTGAVRGLLCGHCNTGLGRFRDDPALLRAAIKYLGSRSQVIGEAKTRTP
jgi:hypothetical protein